MTRLLGITPGDGRQLEPWIEALGSAGLPGLLIREPELPESSLRALVLLAERHVPWVAVHGRNPAAERMGRPVHVRSNGAAPTGVSHGRSCHSWDEVASAFGAGASWVTWSPVWRPTSKPDDTRTPIGIERFLEKAAWSPIYALGGVTPSRFGDLRAGGAMGAAVMGGLFGVATPDNAADRCWAYLSADSSISNGNNASNSP